MLRPTRNSPDVISQCAAIAIPIYIAFRLITGGSSFWILFAIGVALFGVFYWFAFSSPPE